MIMSSSIEESSTPNSSRRRAIGLLAGLLALGLAMSGCVPIPAGVLPTIGAPPIDYFPAAYRKPARPVDADLRAVQVRIAGEGQHTGPIELFDPIGGTFLRESTAERVRGASLSSELERALNKVAANGGVFDGSSTHHVNLMVTVLRLEHFAFKPHEMTARYQLVDRDMGTVLLERTIESFGDATLADAFQGVVRIRIANNRLVQDNVRRFIESL